MTADSACAIHAPNDLECWGRLPIGHDAPVHFQVPTLVSTTQQWASVGVLANSVCAATLPDRTLWCWDGATDLHQVGTQAGFTMIASGDASTHACGLVGGDLYCWGANTHGELGLGATDATIHDPTRVGTDGDWTAVVPHDAPTVHTCGLRAQKLYCWGDGYGPAPVQVGGNTDWSYLAPTTLDTGLRGGVEYAWDATTAPASTGGTIVDWSVKIGDAGIRSNGSLYDATGNLLQNGPFVGLAGETEHCAVATNGALWCWGGSDAEGELGYGTAWSTTPREISLPSPL
jgi:hypothetical protein